jgi:hydrogenase nickel incorporation protein HypA/HybF
MHEMSVARRALDVAEAVLRAHGGAKVNAVRLSVGAMAHIDDGALRFAFAALSCGGAAEGAELRIEREAFNGACTDCGQTVQAEQLVERCPRCRGTALRWAPSGDAEVVSVEIAVEAPI